MNIQCPVRGHHHNLVQVKEHTQVGTGAKAVTLECPNGAYRWFWIIGYTRSIDRAPKMIRPRWGWKK